MLFVDDSDPMGAPGRPRVSGERPPRDNGRKRSHWMISSARTSNHYEIVRPSALAVFRLMTASNLPLVALIFEDGRGAAQRPRQSLSP